MKQETITRADVIAKALARQKAFVKDGQAELRALEKAKIETSRKEN